MKVLLVFLLVIGMAGCLVYQNSIISELRASLADEQAKSAGLQTELNKKEVATKTMPSYKNPLDQRAVK